MIGILDFLWQVAMRYIEAVGAGLRDRGGRDESFLGLRREAAALASDLGLPAATQPQALVSNAHHQLPHNHCRILHQ